MRLQIPLVVTKETMTVEGMIKIVYDLLKDKPNIAKITFMSGVNAASTEFKTHNNIGAARSAAYL